LDAAHFDHRDDNCYHGTRDPCTTTGNSAKYAFIFLFSANFKTGALSKTFTASIASLVVARASSAGMESAIAPDLHCAR
jgi:hypothetical protein